MEYAPAETNPAIAGILVDAAFLLPAETVPGAEEAKFPVRWAEAAVAILSSAGALALAWPPENQRKNNRMMAGDPGSN